MITVSESMPPPLPEYGGFAYWERCADPMHPDALKGTPAESVIQSDAPRVDVWLGIDWCENAVCIVQDGKMFDSEPTGEWFFAENRFGNKSAFPLPLCPKLAQWHNLEGGSE